MADLFALNEPAVSTSAAATEKASQRAAENDVLSAPIKKTRLALFRTPSIIGRTCSTSPTGEEIGRTSARACLLTKTKSIVKRSAGSAESETPSSPPSSPAGQSQWLAAHEQQQETDDVESAYWTEKATGAHRDIALLTIWEKHAVCDRERVRQLNLKTVVKWIYQVLQV